MPLLRFNRLLDFLSFVVVVVVLFYLFVLLVCNFFLFLLDDLLLFLFLIRFRWCFFYIFNYFCCIIIIFIQIMMKVMSKRSFSYKSCNEKKVEQLKLQTNIYIFLKIAPPVEPPSEIYTKKSELLLLLHFYWFFSVANRRLAQFALTHMHTYIHKVHWHAHSSCIEILLLHITDYRKKLHTHTHIQSDKWERRTLQMHL